MYGMKYFFKFIIFNLKYINVFRMQMYDSKPKLKLVV